MKQKRYKRRYITLMEIMIVIVLIGLIGGVLAYNMRGSLDRGRMAATAAAGSRLHNILEMAIAQGTKPSEVKADIQGLVERSGLVRNPNRITKDAWGNDFQVELDGDLQEIRIYSSLYCEKWKAQHGASTIPDDEKYFQ